LSDDANGLVQGVSKIRAGHGDGLPVNFVGPPCKIAVKGGRGRKKEGRKGGKKREKMI